MFVFGTAGHVDHGKSTFLRIFTGIEPDRLPEEKRRGMTLELNFVWKEVAGKRIGIIDVPGHEDLVKTMVGGAMQIDGFLFIVAADDGWMPQSEEHLKILCGLGITRGLAIITKADVVEADQLQKVQKLVKERLFQGCGTKIPVLPFSPYDETLLKQISKHFETCIENMPPPRAIDQSRVWIDRVFSPKGLGTIVTGTLREGEIRVGEALAICPEGEEVMVKGIEVYHAPVESASPNARVALQLSKMAKGKVTRGMLIQKKSERSPQGSVVVALNGMAEPSPNEKKRRKNFRATFYLGTLRVSVLIVFLGEVKASTFARLCFEWPIPVRLGERFIIRSSGEEETLYWGHIISFYKKRQSHEAILGTLKRWNGNAQDIIEVAQAQDPVLDLNLVERDSIFTKEEVRHAMTSNVMKEIGSRWLVDVERWNGWLVGGRKILALFPEGITEGRLVKEVLERAHQPIWFESYAKELLKAFPCHREGGKWFPPSAEKEMSAHDLALLERFSNIIHPMTMAELCIGNAEESVWSLVKNGNLVRIGGKHFVPKGQYEKFAGEVKRYLIEHKICSTSQLKEWSKLSRKPLILLLEQMDRDRITYLKDGMRALLGTAR